MFWHVIKEIMNQLITFTENLKLVYKFRIYYGLKDQLRFHPKYFLIEITLEKGFPFSASKEIISMGWRLMERIRA